MPIPSHRHTADYATDLSQRPQHNPPANNEEPEPAYNAPLAQPIPLRHRNEKTNLQDRKPQPHQKRPQKTLGEKCGLTFRARTRPETEAMVNGGRTTRKMPFPRLPCTVGISGIGFRGRIPGAVRSPPRPSLPLSRPALPIRAAAWLRRCKTLRHPNRSEWVPVRVNTRASSSTCQTNSQSGSIRHSQERAHSPDSRCARWRGSSGSPANSRSTTAHNLSRPLPRRRQRRRSLSNRLVTSSRMPQRWAAFIASRVSYSVRSSRS